MHLCMWIFIYTILLFELKFHHYYYYYIILLFYVLICILNLILIYF